MQHVCAGWGHSACWEPHSVDGSGLTSSKRFVSAVQKLCVNPELSNQPVMEHLKRLLKTPVTPNLGSNLTIDHGLVHALPALSLFAALGRNPEDPLVLKGRDHSMKAPMAPAFLPPGTASSPLGFFVSSRSQHTRVPAKHTFPWAL